MLDVESVTKLLLAAQLRLKDTNPYDYCFNALNFKLKWLDPKSIDYKLIAKYINISGNSGNHQWSNSEYDKYKIKNIFAINKDTKGKSYGFSKEDEEKYNNIHNHFMLFHGSSNANILSIIEQGLQIKPVNSSTKHGSAFGEGIYFAD